MKDQIKAHVKKYKTVYCCVATGIVVAGITGVIMRTKGSFCDCAYSQRRGAAVHTAKPQMNIGSQFIEGIVNGDAILNSYVGNGKIMSKIVKNDLTKEWFISQADAARTSGISEPNLSKYLNHGTSIPGKPELSFSRMGIVA